MCINTSSVAFLSLTYGDRRGWMRWTARLAKDRLRPANMVGVELSTSRRLEAVLTIIGHCLLVCPIACHVRSWSQADGIALLWRATAMLSCTAFLIVVEVRWCYNGSFFSSLFSAKVIHLSFDLWRQLLIPVQRANWIYLVPCRLGNLAEPSICSLNVMSMADFSGPIYLRVNIFEAISSWSSQAICWTTNYLISRGCKNKSIMSFLRWRGHQSYLRIHVVFVTPFSSYRFSITPRAWYHRA